MYRIKIEIVVLYTILVLTSLFALHKHYQETPSIQNQPVLDEYEWVIDNKIVTDDNMEAHEILCERNGVERPFIVLIPSSIDDYDREFEFRAACEMFANMPERWPN